MIDFCNGSTNPVAFTAYFEQGEVQKGEGDVAYCAGNYKRAFKKYADAYVSLSLATSEMANYYIVLSKLRNAYRQIPVICSQIEEEFARPR